MKKPAGLAGFLCFNFGKGEIELSASDRSSHADSRRRKWLALLLESVCGVRKHG
jgi:hypothetical protein